MSLPPKKKASPSPSKGGDALIGYSLKQLEICEWIKDIPSFGGAWGGFSLVSASIPREHLLD